MKKAYIIMADIIDSSSYAGSQLMDNFKTVVAQVNSEYVNSIKSPLTITLGDEFQGIVKSLDAAIDVIFGMDERLLNTAMIYRLRYVINYGVVDTPINKENAHEMLGEGLTLARERLEDLKKEDAEIAVSGIKTNMGEKLNLALRLYRSLYKDWHDKDRKLVHDFLQKDDYKVLARKHKKDPSSMWRKRKSLKIEDFEVSKQLVKLIAHE